MGSPCQILIDVLENSSNLNKIPFIRSQLLTEMERLEKKYSRFKPDSTLSKINNSLQACHSLEIDDETLGLLNYADTAYEISDGLFDITIAPLSRLWDFRSQIIPSDEEIKKALKNVSWSSVSIDKRKISANKAVNLDLGGIVKEYAADRLAALLHLAECSASLINLGGDIRVVGPKISGLPWKISVDDFANRLTSDSTEKKSIHSKKNEMLPVLYLKSGAVATSGTDYRGFWIDKTWYCHLINSKTGWPIPRTLLSVTTITDLCVTAGTLTTTALLFGKQKAEMWLDQLSVAYIIRDVNQSWNFNDKFKELMHEH